MEVIFLATSIFRYILFGTRGNIQNSQHEAELTNYFVGNNLLELGLEKCSFLRIRNPLLYPIELQAQRGTPPFLHSVFETKSKILLEAAYPPTTGDLHHHSNSHHRGRYLEHALFQSAQRS
ncbi:MAG: hypothetical protein OEV79_07970 [candidate division WOR-3 bacterium]|nr:hypothetical protein [candidate division WOR-3 bacterium]